MDFNLIMQTFDLTSVLYLEMTVNADQIFAQRLLDVSTLPS